MKIDMSSVLTKIKEKIMDRLFETTLVMVILILCCWCMWLSHETILATEQMSHEIQIAFLKS